MRDIKNIPDEARVDLTFYFRVKDEDGEYFLTRTSLTDVKSCDLGEEAFRGALTEKMARYLGVRVSDLELIDQATYEAEDDESDWDD